MTASTAKVLGKTEEYKEYSGIAEKTRNGFIARFYDKEKGTFGPYGGNIFALRMGLPGDIKARTIEALRSDIKAADGHLDTGIFGTQFFFEVLAENGMNDLAYAAINKRTMPSYGWWIEQGATTSWEEWDRPGSGNHPMFGGGLVWLYRKLAGMNADPENPGYKHIIFRPQPVGDLTQCSYSNFTPFGLAGVKWTNIQGKFTLEITVPVGSTATVYIPSKNGKISGGIPKKNLKKSGFSDGYSILNVGSGNYSFSSEL
jgi:alpha-L-rhamnosidase